MVLVCPDDEPSERIEKEKLLGFYGKFPFFFFFWQFWQVLRTNRIVPALELYILVLLVFTFSWNFGVYCYFGFTVL
ncbi:hypothetical protein RchiOBHm_Chr3g0497291 [Rosa chinensis]|uniref:Uncharacterized protein n=1 Tax=Rosa chinensis TaxID=74649 RepID=A0A2P6RHQ0_ROSCH|nr:hypothetical protein RchiOBHm_Chr3g0497291 [Rosa chinensis]